MDNNESSDLPPLIEDKKRHGCLSLFLILSILGGVITILGNLSTVLIETPRSFELKPSWVYITLSICGLINIVSFVAVFKWKKWGFWLFSITALFVFCINLYAGANITVCLIGLSGVALFLGALLMGNKTGWSQLD